MNHLISTKNLNILKASLPFFPTSLQKNLAMFVKINEFQQQFQNFNNALDTTISACSIESDSTASFSLSDVLFAIKPYLDDNEANLINQIMNMLNILRLYHSFGSNPSSLLNALSSMQGFSGQTEETEPGSGQTTPRHEPHEADEMNTSASLEDNIATLQSLLSGQTL